MASIFIVARNKSKSESQPNDGRELLIHMDFISAIGEEVGLPRLDDFVFTPTEQIYEFLKQAGASEEEIEKVNPQRWYSADEGLEIMKGYIDALNNYHSISRTTLNAVTPELEDFYRIFETLKVENNEWHFEYDT